MRCKTILCVTISLSLAACGGGTTNTTPSGRDGPIRDEGFCAVDGFAKPLRQSLILIDANVLVKTNDGSQFAARNAAIRDAILSIADPKLVESTGSSAPRERIVIAVAPRDGTAARAAFSGCVPGYSEAEIAQLRAKVSSFEKLTTSDARDQLDEKIAEFRKNLIGGMTAAASMADGDAITPRGKMSDASVFASLKASRGLYDSNDVAQRIIVITDLSRLSADAPQESTPKSSGITEGRAAGAAFRGAEVHFLQPPGKPLTNKDWLNGFVLGQQGFLGSYTSGRFASVSSAPSRRMRFAGTATYPSGPQSLTVVIGVDQDGKLSGSSMILGSSPEYAVPMTGGMACSVSDECELNDDKAGFAQFWRTKGGAEPQFSDDMPFGGMRRFRLRLEGTKLTGEVYDESVIVDGSEKHSIPVQADLK
jgi:hypothetical protein